MTILLRIFVLLNHLVMKTIHLFLALIGLALFQSGFAQKLVYERFDGYIGNGTAIQMNLTHQDSVYFGNYFLKAKDSVTGVEITGYQFIEVEGLRKGNTLVLDEFDGRGAHFEAEISLDKEELNGYWQDGAGRERLPFNMRESFPEGSMKFRYMQSDEQGRLFEMSKKPFMDIQLACPIPDFTKHAGKVEDAVNDQIASLFYNENFPTRNIRHGLIVYKDELIAAYRAKNEAIFNKENIDAFNWRKKQEVRIIFNYGNILSLGMNNTAYSGGKRATVQEKYRVVSLKDGREIQLEDVFDTTNMPKLSSLIEEKIREIYQLNDSILLSKAGFFMDSIPVSTNYFITNAGICFVYNYFEIAGFENGIIRIPLSKEFLRELSRNSCTEIAELWY